MREVYRYEDLEQIPGAAGLIGAFSGALWQSGDEFEVPLPPEPLGVTLRWRASASSSGIATLRCEGHLASLSLLASGINAESDHLTLEAFQRHLLSELRDTGFEPAFELMDLKERPLVATINFRAPQQPERQLLVALADRCFAAAYFRKLGLA
jgi:hypothetical protein